MSKALFGTHAMPCDLRLLDEVQRLRARVEELEAALATAEAHARGAAPERSDVDPVHAPAGH